MTYFGALILNLTSKISISRIFLLARTFWFFLKKHGISKKSQCKNHVKRGHFICKIMRGFQIWPHNSNRITFGPLLGQRTVESRDFENIRRISLFSTVFGQKELGFWAKELSKIGILKISLEYPYFRQFLAQKRFKFYPIWKRTERKWGFLKISLEYPYFDSFWPKRGSNVIRLEFCGLIWNPLIILHVIGPF